MNPFSYQRASDEADAIARAHAPDAKYLGGGTNLIDLMRETIEKPAVLVDVTHLSRQIEERDGGLWIGAAVRNTALAEHPVIRAKYPVIARAILAGASAQIRNMATVGGNLLQRTRCAYFYDPAARCNKRSPGSGCDAIGGFHRTHAVLGTSDACIASHPSDLCVALAALDATVHVKSDRGERAIPFTQLHVLPGERPEVETTLQPGELIVAVTLPTKTFAKQTYRKVRDRASYAFALVSVAAAIARDGEVRLALGGVGTVPWRARKAERELRGTLTKDVIRAAIDAELADAQPLPQNEFKLELARRTVTAVLMELVGGAP